MTDFTSPEIGNKRLANCVFLQTSDMLFWDRLMLEIHQLTHPGESIPVPAPEEMGAWQRAFILWERLRDRAVAEERSTVQQSHWLVEDEKSWTQFNEDRESILAALRADVFDEFVLREHLGVEKDDLDDPLVEPDRFGNCRHPQWKQRASRLASAIRFWHTLSGEEKRTLRQMRVVQKLEEMKHERAHG